MLRRQNKCLWAVDGFSLKKLPKNAKSGTIIAFYGWEQARIAAFALRAGQDQ